MTYQTQCFKCTINNCGQRFSQDHALSYYRHIQEDHSATYKQNKEYIDAKLTVLRYEDPELEEFDANGLAL